MCREAHDEIQWLLATLTGGEVCLTAYTIDQPDLVEALIGYKGSVRMIADMGQSQGNRTKLQMQTIQQVSRSGIRVRLCNGAPVHESYKQDRRAVNVGRSIRGLQHSKTMMVRVGDKSYLVIGSANWTTSSRSNVEMGVSIEGQSNLEVFTDYAASFDRTGQKLNCCKEHSLEHSLRTTERLHQRLRSRFATLRGGLHLLVSWLAAGTNPAEGRL
jgi:phosphatidylserine/phosphatidylglycerophosphate/cardiolipin synthase-like enzyme